MSETNGALTLTETDDLTYYRLFDLLSEQERQALRELRWELEKLEAGWKPMEQDAPAGD